MKTLIIHPKDPSTDFLKGIYEGLEDITVIRGMPLADGPTMSQLILSHYRVIALGHGTPAGLLGVGQFAGSLYALDSRHSSLLRSGRDNIYIWCNADQFVQRFRLPSPLYTGMFISEVGEAVMMGLDDVQPHVVDESNAVYASVINKELKRNTPDMTSEAILKYMSVNIPNNVIRYNWERLYRT